MGPKRLRKIAAGAAERACLASLSQDRASITHEQNSAAWSPTAQTGTRFDSGSAEDVARVVSHVATVLRELAEHIERDKVSRTVWKASNEPTVLRVRSIAAWYVPFSGQLSDLRAGYNRQQSRVTPSGPRTTGRLQAELAGFSSTEQEMYSIQNDRLNVAERKAECAVCWEPLVEKPLGVMLKPGGGRACVHFLHASCADQWARSARGTASCPMCRADFASVSVLPDFIKDPHAFFDSLDVNSDGGLDQREAFNSLQAILPVDRDSDWLSAHFDSLWVQWDENSDGSVSLAEFLLPEAGLLAYVQANCPTRAMTQPDEVIPSIADLSEWFAYWDEDGNGMLDEHELIRACIRSFSLEWSLQEYCAVREFLGNFWFQRFGKRSSDLRLRAEDLTLKLWEDLEAVIVTKRRQIEEKGVFDEQAPIVKKQKTKRKKKARAKPVSGSVNHSRQSQEAHGSIGAQGSHAQNS